MASAQQEWDPPYRKPPQEAAPAETILPKILIVEDRRDYQSDYARALGGKVRLLQASTLEEATKLFDENSDVELIVMDACVPGGYPNTDELVQHIRQTYTGPMVASSARSDFRRRLMEIGCDHESRKDAVPLKVIELLKL